MALSNHLELPDYDHTCQDESCRKFQVPVRGKDKTNEDWGQTAAAANKIQPEDHKYLVKGSWQPIEELVENTVTEIDMKTIKDELVHTEHEEICPEALVNDAIVYTDLRERRLKPRISI